MSNLSAMDQLTIPQAAKRLPISETMLRRLVVSGQVPGYKLGRDWIVTSEEIDRLIAQKREPVRTD